MIDFLFSKFMNYVNRIKIMWVSVYYYRSCRLLSINSDYARLMPITIDGNQRNAGNQSSFQCV